MKPLFRILLLVALVYLWTKDSANSQTKAPELANGTEAAHYRMVTVPVPPATVLEVGGLTFRPDGKLAVCTRRGEVWLISHPEAEPASSVQYKLFASGLHEPLGLVA